MFAEILTGCKSLNQNISKLLILNIPPTQVTDIIRKSKFLKKKELLSIDGKQLDEQLIDFTKLSKILNNNKKLFQ